MKRKNLFLVGILSFLMAFSFAACGGNENNSSNSGGTSIEDTNSDSTGGDDSTGGNDSTGGDEVKEVWTVTFDCGAWTTIADVQVEDGETISMPKLPESASYQFIKWTLNGETFDFSTPITGDITLVLVYGTYGDIV